MDDSTLLGSFKYVFCNWCGFGRKKVARHISNGTSMRAKSLSSATKKKRADLQSLAEYLKWELAKELSQFTRDKEATDLVSKQRDHAVFTLGRVETKRRLARRDDDGDRF